MMPELFRIPVLDIPIYSYGLMLVIGLLCATELARFLAKRAGFNPDVFVNAGLIAVFSGIVGARLSSVIENWSEYTRADLSVWQNFLNMINIRSGGLTYYGGFLLATPLTMLYGWYKKVPLRRGMDIIAPALVVGLAFGRIGCLLTGCCWGEVCHTGPAIQFPYDSPAYHAHVEDGRIANVPDALYGETASGRSRLLTAEEIETHPELKALAATQKSLPVHPVQAYSTFTGLLLAAVLVSYMTLQPAPGRVFALMLILEGATRFLLEMLRIEPPIIGQGTSTFSALPPMSISMVISASLVIAGFALWVVFGGQRKTSPATA